MKFALLILSFFCVSFAAASHDLDHMFDPPKYEDLFSKDISLYSIVLGDSRVLKSYHTKFQKTASIIEEKRSLNNGYLPLSKEAKESIVDYLYCKFIDEQKALGCLDMFFATYKIYPLSAQKTIAMLALKYEEDDPFNDTLSTFQDDQEK